MSDVLSANTEDDDFDVVLEIPQILKALLSYPPEIDKAIAPVWLGLLGNGFLAYKNADPRASAGELGEVWKAVWTFLESSDVTIRKASYHSLTLLAKCLTSETITLALQERGQSEPRSALGRIVLEVEKAFESLAFARSVSELLLTISALISNLHYREMPAGPTAAEVLLLPLVQRIGNMRTEKNFEHKGEADRVLSQAMGTMGPAALLNALPLNLEPADRSVHPQLRRTGLVYSPTCCTSGKLVVSRVRSSCHCWRNHIHPHSDTLCHTLFPSLSACSIFSRMLSLRTVSPRRRYGLF